jgi:predicted Zn-dependent peptidase
MSVRVTDLPNGLKVATDTVPTVESVSVGVYIGVGTRQEREEANGVAHLLEHMAFKGTTTRSACQIAEEVEAVGGQMNAHTGREQTAYYIKVLKEDTSLAVELLADILQRSTFDEEEFERERGVILQELGQAEDTPDDVIFDHFQETAYPDQSVGRPVLGRAGIIEHLPRAALIDFQLRHYGARNMVVTAAGQVDHDAFVDLVHRRFTELPSEADGSYEPASYAGGEFRDDRDLEQVHFVLGFPGVSHDDPDYYAAAVLSTLLGGGMSSRLFQEVREKRGLAYAISSFSSSFLDGGVFGIYTGTGENEVADMVPVLVDQIGSVLEPAPEEEVRRARAQMKAGLLMSLESTNARMDALGSHILTYGRPLTVAEITQHIDAVDSAALVRVAKRIFAGRPTMAAMGPTRRLLRVDDIAARIGLSRVLQQA